MQTEAEGDVREKDMRRKVAEKVDTFLSDFRDGGAARRDDVSRLFSDIERDLDGNERESSYILQRIFRLRKDRALDENPTELVDNFEDLVESLEAIKNAKDMAAAAPSTEILPRKHEVLDPRRDVPATDQAEKRKVAKDEKKTGVDLA
jgi:hypothetical protein